MDYDIFDQIESKRRDVFDEVESDRIGDKIFEEVEKELPSLVRTYVKEQTKKIKVLSPKDISDLVDSALSNLPKTKPERIIERTEVKVIAPKETKKYLQESDLEDLKKQIKKLKSLLEEKDKDVSVQYIGTMIPNFNGQDGKVLSPTKGQLTWVEQSSSGGGTSPDAYTPTNVSTLRTYDAANVSIDELANVLGSLIASLQGAGIIQ